MPRISSVGILRRAVPELQFHNREHLFVFKHNVSQQSLSFWLLQTQNIPEGFFSALSSGWNPCRLHNIIALFSYCKSTTCWVTQYTVYCDFFHLTRVISPDGENSKSAKSRVLLCNKTAILSNLWIDTISPCKNIGMFCCFYSPQPLGEGIQKYKKGYSSQNFVTWILSKLHKLGGALLR